MAIEIRDDSHDALLRQMHRFTHHAPSLKPVFDAFARIPRSTCEYNPFRDALNGQHMRLLHRNPRRL